MRSAKVTALSTVVLIVGCSSQCTSESSGEPLIPVELPTIEGPRVLKAAPTVWINSDQIGVSVPSAPGEEFAEPPESRASVLKLDNGKVPSDALDSRGFRITELEKALKGAAEFQTQVASVTGATRDKTLTLKVDKAIPYETVARVLYTAAMEQFTQIQLALKSGDVEKGLVTGLPRHGVGVDETQNVEVGRADLLLSWTEGGVEAKAFGMPGGDPSSGSWDLLPARFGGSGSLQPPYLDLTVQIRSESGGCPLIRRSAKALEVASLSSTTEALCASNNNYPFLVILNARPETPYQELMNVAIAALPPMPCQASILMSASMNDHTTGEEGCEDALPASEVLAYLRSKAANQRENKVDLLGSPIGDESVGAKVGIGTISVRGGGLSQDVARKTVLRKMNELNYCSSRILESRTGRVDFELTLSPEGTVQQPPIVASTTLAEPRFEACVSNKIGHWIFPRPKNGGAVIRVPLFVTVIRVPRSGDTAREKNARDKTVKRIHQILGQGKAGHPAELGEPNL